MLVIAFDGVLFHTLEGRAMVLSDALSAAGVTPGDEAVRNAIVGRTFSEAARLLAPSLSTGGVGALDDTSLDIVALRADQSFTALANRGLSLNTHVRDALQRAATVTRVVLRSDSRRKDVGALLSLAGLDATVSMTRCSDDPAAGLAPPQADEHFTASLRRSYGVIAERMQQHRSLLGERGPSGVALESGGLGERIAAAFGFETAHSVSALHLPSR